MAERIKNKSASLTEIVEWLELTSSHTPIQADVIQLLRENLTIAFGDGFYDGFRRAQFMAEDGQDLSEIGRYEALELSEQAEIKCRFSRQDAKQKKRLSMFNANVACIKKSDK
ncbi:hypothetical protein [Vibrio sonorensis]|uniref:hypothetical protein n=1 Tax=Vibrio sonorensis TaxID=1004316 RepID=UPI001C2FAD4A|nr:hypothetical protein [Vibrio sonorensis]